MREAIIDAVAHADYSQRGAPLRLAIFDDRLEVENPGLLTFGLTLEDLPRGVSKLRNRVIGRSFHALGLIEQKSDFYFASFITRADSSSHAQAGVLMNLQESHSSTGFRLQSGADLGGASGGPVFCVHDGSIRPLELVGFIYEYSESLELIYARHAAPSTPMAHSPLENAAREGDLERSPRRAR